MYGIYLSSLINLKRITFVFIFKVMYYLNCENLKYYSCSLQLGMTTLISFPSLMKNNFL